jgi:hypothetical protein
LFGIIEGEGHGKNGWWILFNKFSLIDSGTEAKKVWFWKIITFQKFYGSENLKCSLFGIEFNDPSFNVFLFQFSTFYIFIILPIYVLLLGTLKLKSIFWKKGKKR